MRRSLAVFERVRFEVASEVLCARCQEEVERHQPDVDEPSRLLGTCGHCGAWYLIDAEAGVMVALPDVKALRDSCA